MKRALISQMANEWRSNIWLIVEMAIVALSIMVILFNLWVQNKGYFESRGFDPEHVYSLTIKEIGENSPYYQEEFSGTGASDTEELLKRLSENPNVESVGRHDNFLPYNYNWAGNVLQIEGVADSTFYSANFRFGDPGMIDVLRVKSITGKSRKELKKMLAEGKILISPFPGYIKDAPEVTEWIGKTATPYGDENRHYIIGDVVEYIHRTDFEAQYGKGMVILPLISDLGFAGGSIGLRVKPGREKEFENDFKEDRALSHYHNTYLSDLQSLPSIREGIQSSIKVEIRILVVITIFLLVTIFLGLLGSFWFRVQQRVSEMAIRKTFGASDRELFGRILSEGLLLLAVGLSVASIIFWPFIGKIVEITGMDWYEFLAMEGIAAALMVLGVLVSLIYPARRAMKIEPAIAIKEE